MSKTISQLDPAVSLDGTEVVEIEQGGVSVRTTVQEIANLYAGAATAGQLNGINDQIGTAYTLALTDKGKDVRCTNAAAVTLTVPPSSNVAFPVGAVIFFSQGGAGAVTAVKTAGMPDLQAPFGAATTAQYDARGLEYLGSDVWRVW